MRSSILVLILFMIMNVGVNSQEYRDAVSLRLGLSSGITYQHLIDDFRGYKGMLSYREGGLQVTALLESYRPLYLKSTDKMFYYTGMGAHIGFTRYPPKFRYNINPFRYYSGEGRFAPVIGLDAIIGLEYRLDRAPLEFSLDVKPFFELFGQTIFRLSLFDFGLSIKFTFN